MSKQLPDDGDAGRGIDDPAIAELLDTVREARTSLAIELSAAAGALEAGRPEVARDIVAATAEEMQLVAARSHLSQANPATVRQRVRGRRALLALPAIPLVGAIAMTAAAALGGTGTPDSRAHSLGTNQHVVRVSSSHTTIALAHSTATTTLHRLENVVTHHPQAAQVIAVADDLHNQLTAMIATATNDPARLHVVRQLLLLEQHVLESSKVPGTQLALAASRAIARLLEQAPNAQHVADVPQHATPTQPTKPHATATPTQTPVDATHHVQSHSSHVSQPHRTPGVMSTNALFGGRLFNRP